MSDQAELAHLIDGLSSAQVLVVGDLMLDHFVSGVIDRISPEAPVPVLRITGETSMLGGAGNVVGNISALGGMAHLIACIGDDATGQEVKQRLSKIGDVTAHLIVDEEIETTIKTRYLSGSQQILRTDRETRPPYSEATGDEIFKQVMKVMNTCSVIILSDYDKGVLSETVIHRIINHARDNSIPVLVDPKGTDYSLYKGATLITPNKRELGEATRLPVETDEDIIGACKKLMTSCGVHGVLATRSAEGMTLVDGDGVTHLPAQAREVFDVSGAGDTVIAMMATAIGAGLTDLRSATLANVAASVAVAKVGTATVSASDVKAALIHQEISGAENKMVSGDAALERIAVWRRQGFKVGFTNGCFDMLHPGHISLLQQARSSCDRLVVGLNSDSSVKRLKGEDRPVQTETSRATVLGSLEAVDLVVIFDEDTPLSVITQLLPDVLIKGADYKIDQVVGADVVQRNGGKVVLAQLVEGHSTTSTLSRLNKTSD